MTVADFNIVSDDAPVKISDPHAVNFGKEGHVLEKNGAGHYRMVFKEKDNFNVPYVKLPSFVEAL